MAEADYIGGANEETQGEDYADYYSAGAEEQASYDDASHGNPYASSLSPHNNWSLESSYAADYATISIDPSEFARSTDYPSFSEYGPVDVNEYSPRPPRNQTPPYLPTAQGNPRAPPWTPLLGDMQPPAEEFAQLQITHQDTSSHGLSATTPGFGGHSLLSTGGGTTEASHTSDEAWDAQLMESDGTIESLAIQISGPQTWQNEYDSWVGPSNAESSFQMPATQTWNGQNNDSMDGNEGSMRSIPYHLSVPGQPRARCAPSVSSIAPAGLPGSLMCQVHKCAAVFSGKYRTGNLQRHCRLKHSQDPKRYPCESDQCMKTFWRQDARIKHYRSKHPEFNVLAAVPKKKRSSHRLPQGSGQ